MPDETRRSKTEKQVISAADGYALNYWARQLRCTEQELLVAIAAVGNDAGDVRHHLAKQRQGPAGGLLACA
jgi:Protein of unknown function (DUF3606)